MRAALLTGHGGPDQLTVRTDIDDPKPGPGQVLIRVAASSINNTDIWSRQGAYDTAADADAQAGWRGVPLTFPRIQGADITGTVVAEGPGVNELLHRRVLVDPATYDHDGPDATPIGLLGSEQDGGFAELVVVDARRAHDVTDSPLSNEQLAALPTAYGTAMGMIQRGCVGAGDRVVVTGSSGGVGLAAVQLAANAGAHVIAVTTATKAYKVRQAGAHVVLDRTVLQHPAQLLDATGGPVSAILDVVGGTHFGRLFELLGTHGRIVVSGAIAGPVVSLDLRQVYLDQRRIIGSTMHTPAHFAALATLARTGAVQPRIAGRFALDDIHRAQEEFSSKQFVGKLVVVPHP